MSTAASVTIGRTAANTVTYDAVAGSDGSLTFQNCRFTFNLDAPLTLNAPANDWPELLRLIARHERELTAFADTFSGIHERDEIKTVMLYGGDVAVTNAVARAFAGCVAADPNTLIARASFRNPDGPQKRDGPDVERDLLDQPRALRSGRLDAQNDSLIS